MKNIKAIETYYNGYRFRSRAEARWAVLLDSLRCLYIPEPEGVMLSDGTWYLPDFYLPESDSFLEVKGILDDTDLHKIQQLIEDSGKAVTIGYADMTFWACDNFTGWGDSPDGRDPKTGEIILCRDSYGNTIESVPSEHALLGNDSWLCRCKTCGKIFFMASFGSYVCPCCGEYDGDHHFEILLDSGLNRGNGGKICAYRDGEIALNKARQARFEHGEKP